MADLSLGSVGLGFPALLEAYRAIRETCQRIRNNLRATALLKRKCHSLLIAVRDAVKNSPSDSHVLKQEVETLTRTLLKVARELNEVAPVEESWFQSFKRRELVEEALIVAREDIQDALSRFTLISQASLHSWNAEERKARQEDNAQVKETVEDIRISLKNLCTDIPGVIRPLLPEALRHHADQVDHRVAQDEGEKAAAWFQSEIDALRAACSPFSSELEDIITRVMELVRNGYAVPAGYTMSSSHTFPSYLLRVRVKHLETEEVHDQDIVLRYDDCVENVIHELRRPRRPPIKPYNPIRARLYVRRKGGHKLSPRGMLWTSARGQDVVIVSVPRANDGYYELDLVDRASEFLIALVVDGTKETGAVLEYKDALVYELLRHKWPHLQVAECHRIVEQQAFPVFEGDTCKSLKFRPYEFALCVRFSGSN